jgi:hypothetical protein
MKTYIMIAIIAITVAVVSAQGRLSIHLGGGGYGDPVYGGYNRPYGGGYYNQPYYGGEYL